MHCVVRMNLVVVEMDSHGTVMEFVFRAICRLAIIFRGTLHPNGIVQRDNGREI